MFPLCLGLRYDQPFRGPIRLTNYNFHALFTTIAVVLTNTAMWKVHSMCVWWGEVCLSSDESDPS